MYVYCVLLIFVHYIEYLARISDLSDLIYILDDDVDVYLADSTAGVGSRIVGVASTISSSDWVPFTGLLLVICLFAYYFMPAHFLSHFLVCYSSGTVEVSVIVTNMCRYGESNGDFRYGYVTHYFGDSGCGSLPDVLANSYLDTDMCLRWSMSFSFEHREVPKKKGCDRIICPFCVRITFDRSVGAYVVKVCQLFHLDHVVNLSSTVGHGKFEAALYIEERSQLVNFGKIGYTGLQSKNWLSRLLYNRTYDSEMIYRVVKNAWNFQYGDATDYMLKLVVLGNYHKSKGGVFEIASDRGIRLETLYWLGSLFPCS